MPPITLIVSEWETVEPLPGTPLYQFFLEDKAQLALAEKLSQRGMLGLVEKRHGLAVETYSYVGSLTLGDLQLIIRPKIKGAPLLRLLRYAYGLRDLELFPSANYALEESLFQDLLIHQLVAEVNELLSRGLRREYIETRDSLASPRGRFDMQALARQGGITQAEIPCIHYPRLENNLINQTVLAGLLLAARLTDDLALRTRARRLAALLQQNISALRLTHQVLQTLSQQRNRLTAAYDPALALIEILFEAEGIHLDADEPPIKLPGFLFDMNRFFEVLIARFLGENLPEYEVQPQYRIRYMMHYIENPQRRKPPTPCPDVVITQASKVITMLDTKYRDLWEKPLPRDMLYQLAIYALSQGDGGTAIILYPTILSSARDARIEIREPLRHKKRADVILRPVNLLALDNVIFATKRSALSQKAKYAREIVLHSVHES